MNHIRLIAIPLFVSGICLHAGVQEIEVIRGRSLANIIEKSNLFIKTMEDIEWIDNSLYLLDSDNGQIIEISLTSGNQLRIISRKGQGPNELMSPCRIRVRNQKIFVLDKGNRALKIFDLSGNFIGQFKPLAFGNPYFYRSFDVDQNDEIYFPEVNGSKGTLVGVYSLSGEKKSDIVACTISDKDMITYVNMSNYGIGIDSEGAFYLNFPLLHELWRCTKDGKVLWKIHIENALLKKAPEKSGARINKNGKLSWGTFMRGMEITPDGKALICHFGGGCLVNKQGVMEKVINIQTWNEENRTWRTDALAVYRIREGKIIGASLGQSYWLNLFSMEAK